MHEHKKFKGRKNRRASIDGIISDGRRLGMPEGGLQPSKREKQAIGLGGIASQVEGFHPMRATTQGLGELVDNPVGLGLDEPIVLDEPTKKKKRFSFKLHKPKSRTVLKRGGLVLAALVLIIGGYLGFKFYQTERNLFRGGGNAPGLSSVIDINQLKTEGDSRINILILGIGGPGHDGPDLTDTIMLASIDPVNDKVALLSIPRDLCVSMPCGPNQKINAVYAFAKENSSSKTTAGQVQDGIKKLDSTLTGILGVPIHYHMVVDFTAFKDAVDAVGGVDINVPEELYDPTIAWENNWNPVIAQKGMQHMNGAKALLYAKSRETSSDFARAERQRLILVALKDKVLSAGTFSNPVKISNLLSSLGNNVYTDFSLSDITRLYQIVSKIPSGNIASLDMVTPPHDLLTTGSVDGTTSIVEPKAGLFDYTAMQAFVRSSLPDGFIVKENAPVAVYNATNTDGLATSKADLLKSYGYNVTTVDSAKVVTSPAKTILVDLTGDKDKYTKHYLQNRFGVTAISTVPPDFGITPPQNTAFVIILGQDAATNSQN